MSLNPAGLRDLLRRAQRATHHNYELALAEHYARELGGTGSSPAAIVDLCKAALAAAASGTVPPSPVDEATELTVAIEPAPVEEDRSTWAPSAPEPEPVELESEELADEQPELAENETPGADEKPESRKKRRRRSGK